MKHIKTTIFSLVVVIALICSLTGTAIAQSSQEITEVCDFNYTISEPYTYPVVPGTDEWYAIDTHQEMIDVCQIPEDILEKMTTEALVESVLAYPLMIDMLMWNNLGTGIEKVKSYFNGLDELLSREDACVYLGNYLASSQQNVNNRRSTPDERNQLRYATILYNNLNGPIGGISPNSTTITYVYTPDNQRVKCYKNLTYTELNQLFDYDVPFTERDLDDYEKTLEDTYPRAERISSRNPSYNCHSYAFYSQSTSNNVWLLEIDPYFEESYRTLGSGEMDDAARGDIVLYIVDRSSGIIGHSARITDPDLDNLTVKSKWDFMGVYEHPADYCPYAEDIDGLMIAQRT